METMSDVTECRYAFYVIERVSRLINLYKGYCFKNLPLQIKTQLTTNFQPLLIVPDTQRHRPSPHLLRAHPSCPEMGSQSNPPADSPFPASSASSPI
jgi:hypothetical protein